MSISEKIYNQVPFGRSLYGWLCIHNLHLCKLVRRDDMEDRYLAWETVRKNLNPFFYTGTGFEGYLVGRCSEPEAALETILAINQHILDSIAQLYRFEYNFRSRLMKTLLREDSDPASIHIWSGCLGAELGRLRAQILGNFEAQAFQRKTYSIITTLPPIIYHEIDNDVAQTYAIGDDPFLPKKAKMVITLPMLKASQQDAWLVAQNIGEFGHPLVRKFLDH
jgi:hypothetical protein